MPSASSRPAEAWTSSPSTAATAAPAPPRWITHRLDPTLKSVRFARYLETLRHVIGRLCRACGAAHPALITRDHLEILDDRLGSINVNALFGYDPSWQTKANEQCEAITRLTVHSDAPVAKAI